MRLYIYHAFWKDLASVGKDDDGIMNVVYTVYVDDTVELNTFPMDKLKVVGNFIFYFNIFRKDMEIINILNVTLDHKTSFKCHLRFLHHLKGE